MRQDTCGDEVREKAEEVKELRREARERTKRKGAFDARAWSQEQSSNVGERERGEKTKS